MSEKLVLGRWMVRRWTERETNRRRVYEKWGRMAETVAAIMLCLQGHYILARRWKSVVGEIDIIARRGNSLIFCEVKFRQDGYDSGVPSRRQQHRIMRAAEDFTRQRRISPNLEWRFDLIQISAPFHGKWRIFTHIRNAWQADDG